MISIIMTMTRHHGTDNLVLTVTMACCAAEQQPGLFHDVVLGPLVCSDALQPVQSQLIVKVLKEVVAAHIR